MLPLHKFSRRQILTLFVFSIADFCNAICVSLQAPFYPQEAEKKGATAAEYGLVFGIFELVVFVVSPFYGQNLNRVGPKLMFNAGILITGLCAVLFGLLDKVDGRYTFISLSFIIRIVEAMGNAAFLTASFAIIAKEFPDNVGTTFASLETFFGLGLIVGPTVGGALYQVGGYTTPFVVLGGALFLTALMTIFALPDHGDHDLESQTGASLLEILRIPGVFLAAISIMVTSLTIGFLSATLEPHLRQFNLSPVVLGVMFVVNGGTYALTAPCWGWLVDKKINPKVATVIGSVLLIVAFCLVGPAPFLPTLEPGSNDLLLLITIGLVIHGLGIAAELVASFTDALRTVIALGYPNNIESYGLISGLWTSTFAFGAFLGPSVSGVLYDTIGFRNSTVFVICISAILGITAIVFMCLTKPHTMYTEIKSESTDTISQRKFSNSLSALSDHFSNSTSALNVGSTQSLHCPPGMSGIITCNSYKNRLGNFHRMESNTVLNAQLSSSYGSYERKAYFGGSGI